MATDAIAKLCSVGRNLSPKVRAEVLALGPAAIPRLLDLLERDQGGLAPLHAVDLLVDLKADEAIRPMLRVLDELPLDDELSNRIAVRLPELGAAVLEPALELLSGSEEEDTEIVMCEVLSKLGVRDERVFQALCALFESVDDGLAAAGLADYGDPRGRALLERALAEFEPDFESRMSKVELNELVDAYGRMGGKLEPRFVARMNAWSAEWDARRAAEDAAGSGRGPKVGRNESCPCGSGKKYKRCCLAPTDPTAAAPSA